MKYIAVMFAALIASLVLAANAFGTNAQVTVDCQRATFTYTNFGAEPQPSAVWQVSVNGQVVRSGTHEPAGVFTPTDPVTLNVTTNDAFIEASTVVDWGDGRPVVRGTAGGTFDCAPQEAQEPNPRPTPTPTPTTPEETPDRVIDCAFIQSHFSDKVGRQVAKRLDLVCYPPVRQTCESLKKKGAGRKWYRHFKINYWDCHVPTPPPVPYIPPVAG